MLAEARTERMTLLRALRSEALRLARSPLAPVHLACALTGGTACGVYFAYAPWDPAFGADAYVQLLGALMPLMASIVCGLDWTRNAGRDGSPISQALLRVRSPSQPKQPCSGRRARSRCCSR